MIEWVIDWFGWLPACVAGWYDDAGWWTFGSSVDIARPAIKKALMNWLID